VRLRRQLLPLIALIALPMIGISALAAWAVTHVTQDSDALAGRLGQAYADSAVDAAQARKALAADIIADATRQAHWIAHHLDGRRDQLQLQLEGIRDWPALRLSFIPDETQRLGHRAQLRQLLQTTADRVCLIDLALLATDGKELVRVAGWQLGGDLDVGWRAENASEDEQSTPWFSALRSDLTRSAWIGPSADLPDHAPMLSLAAPVRVRANRLARQLDQFDGLLHLSVSLTRFIGDSLEGAANPLIHFHLQLGDGTRLGASGQTLGALASDPTIDADAVVSAPCLDGTLTVVAVIPAGGLERAAKHVNAMVARLETGLREVQDLHASAEHQRRRLLLLTAGAGALLLLLPGIALLVLRRLVLAPLERLAQRARSLATGSVILPGISNPCAATSPRRSAPWNPPTTILNVRRDSNHNSSPT
jgi:hypothetical protein